MAQIFPFLVPIALFVSIATAVVLRGPLGKALGERIAGRAGVGDRESEALRAELEDLRFRVVEMEERLDFAERLLAQQKQRQMLGGAEGG